MVGLILLIILILGILYEIVGWTLDLLTPCARPIGFAALVAWIGFCVYSVATTKREERKEALKEMVAFNLAIPLVFGLEIVFLVVAIFAFVVLGQEFCRIVNPSCPW